MSKPDAKYDARGLGCPLLMIGLNKVINGMPIGDVLEMVSDEDVSRLDVPSWCRRTGHELVDMTEKGGEFLLLSGNATRFEMLSESVISRGTRGAAWFLANLTVASDRSSVAIKDAPPRAPQLKVV